MVLLIDIDVRDLASGARVMEHAGHTIDGDTGAMREGGRGDRGGTRDACRSIWMSIAVDQRRLRRISSALLAGEPLSQVQALAIVEIAQLAAGAAPDEDPQEHTILQAIVQHICSLAGVELDEVMAIARRPDTARRARFDALGRLLATQGACELAYAVAFLVSVSDLELSASESSGLEELQHVLHVGDRRAIDLTVFISEVVEADDAA